MIDYALRYAQAGLKVIPVKGKLPLTVHGAHDATTDEPQIRQWWAQWPDANIGMTLEGLVVVDIDPRNGGSVDALSPLPETCCAKTGGGGWHYLYRAVEGMRVNAHPSPGVDVKTGAGAYIVVEPSVHASGEKYCWLDESEPWSQRPAIAPDWLGRPMQRASGFVGIEEGARNASLTSLAGSMRRRGMSAEAIEAALQLENLRCNPPLPPEEVTQIARSVSRYPPEPAPAAEQGRPQLLVPSAIRDELLRVYREGLGRGAKTGWPSVDALFSVAEGQLTTITGWPNSGKSQWTDALALNLVRQHWQVVFCSLENIPVFLHVEKLVKQLTGKPMRAGPTERMSEAELSSAIESIDRAIAFVMPSESKPNPSLREVIEAIEQECKRRGTWAQGRLACVIDPWNELEHVRTAGLSLTEHVGESLSMLRQWARHNRLHVFVIAHPAKQPRNRDSGKLPIATPDMISDSAHFWNKSDNCITVALVDEHRSPQVDIHVQKVRFAHIGVRGVAELRYDKISGRYHEPLRLAMQSYKEASAGE